MSRLLTGPLLAAALVLAACGGGADPDPGGFGSPVTDGFFTFTVDNFECGSLEVSRGSIRRVARSQFCLLSLTVTNTGEAGRRLDFEAQRLLDGERAEFGADLKASLVINPGLGSRELAPGETVNPTVVFDVNNPVAITTARLHDGIFSDGVETPIRP